MLKERANSLNKCLWHRYIYRCLKKLRLSVDANRADGQSLIEWAHKPPMTAVQSHNIVYNHKLPLTPLPFTRQRLIFPLHHSIRQANPFSRGCPTFGGQFMCPEEQMQCSPLSVVLALHFYRCGLLELDVL